MRRKNLTNPHKSCNQGIQDREGTIGTHRQILAPLESNFKVDLITHYRELTTLQ